MKVLIIGGGFGGVHTALRLANKKGMRVQLISSQSYFEYHAALYRSATGRSPLEVAIPLRDFFGYAKNVEVIKDTVTDIDHKLCRVSCESGETYEYDNLVLALGNVTEYYDIRGLREHSFGVKTVHEALRLKRHLHEQLIESDIERNYVVVGAGATGVELAAELLVYLKRIRKKHKIRRKFSVSLVEAGSSVLPTMPQAFSQPIGKRLRKLGVRVMLDTAVKAETADNLRLPDGSMESHTVVWTAGVVNNPLFTKHSDIFELGKAKRAKVDEFLRAAENIYVIGDSAETMYSGTAQTALHDADFIATNLLRSVKSKPALIYTPKRPVYAVPVGPRWAGVLWGKTRLYGRVGWLLRRLADLRLYLRFLPPGKALTTWRYGFMHEEVCQICKFS